MNTPSIVNQVDPKIIESIVLNGDVSKLDSTQKVLYYNGLCKSLGLNPLTQPFSLIPMQGKQILYANKSCSQQLAENKKINIETTKKELINDIYIVTVRATLPNGRFTDEDGAVPVAGLKGNDLANAYMKAITKSKRRAILALSGLGIPDESEVETMMPSTTSSKLADVVSPPRILKPQESLPAPGQPEPVKNETESGIIAKASVPAVDAVQTIIYEMKYQTSPPGASKSWKLVGTKIGEFWYSTFDTDIQNKLEDAKKNRILVNVHFIEEPSKKDGKLYRRITEITYPHVENVQQYEEVEDQGSPI